MHLILTGATGLIGSAVLDIILNDPEVTKVSILSRSPVPQAWAQEKADAIYVPDFGNLSPELLKKLEDAQGVVWALGDTRRTGIDTPDLDRINVDYPIYAAKAFAKGKKSFNFVFVSMLGIEQGIHEDVVDKGRAETGLMELANENPALKVYSLRLCAMDYRGHTAIHKYIHYPRPWWKVLASWVIPMVKWYSAPLNCDSPDFGFLLTELAKSDGAPLEGEFAVNEGRFLEAQGFNPLVEKLRAQKGPVEDEKTK